MKKEEKSYGAEREIAKTLLNQNSYTISNIERLKALFKVNGISKDTYPYAKKIVNGKIGGIPVGELPENFKRNQASEKNFNNIEMYNSMSKHNSFKLSQHMSTKKEP